MSARPYQITHKLRPGARSVRADFGALREGWPKQCAKLDEALASGDPVRVAEVALEAGTAWNRWGVWPDDWARFQRALDDVFPWNQRIDLDQLLNGEVVVGYVTEEDGS